MDATSQNIVYSGPFLSNSGFSKMNREIVFALQKMGINVCVETAGEKTQVDDITKSRIESLTSVIVPPKTPKIFGMTVPSIFSGDGRRILYTMMESSNSLHQGYVEKLCLSHEVWVPSQYLADLISRHNVNIPVTVIPLGVNPVIFNREVKPMNLSNKMKRFRFLSVFWWSIRKGYDLLLKAYIEEFSSKDDVSLVILTKLHSGANIDEISQKVQAIVNSIGKKNPPHISITVDNMDEGALASLYRACHAFVLPSRGEGFGLPILEAAACGLPVITTRCTAQGSYLDDSTAFLVDPEGYRKSSVADAENSAMAKWCHYYDGQLFPFFGEKSISQLRNQMRKVLEEKETRSEKLSKKIITEMTWAHTAQRIADRLAKQEKP